mmetsp:Transcript_73883/g.171376  ORF Transcript_73883/g.171376 Transcript_73883/m.171376 type:complete len:191 (-) Transcript_73883:88-660(-)
MELFGLTVCLSLVAATVAAECEGPFCSTISQPCAGKQVSTCHIWPHWCSKILHGEHVYCSEDNLCLCGEGTCADPHGKCVAPPSINCSTKVSTCRLFPHHCENLIHGPSVYCSEDHTCLCGSGTCNNHGICVALVPFGNGTSLLESPTAPAWGSLALLVLPAGVVGAVATAAVVLQLRRPSVQAAPFLLG